MTRGISMDGVSLPVTDATISYTKEPIAESSIFDKGNEVIYEGLYKNIQGTFSGAVRESLIADLLEDILADEPATHTIIVADEPATHTIIVADEPATHTIIVADDTTSGLTATNAYLSMLEISARTGELAKFTAQFTAQSISNGGAVEFASFTSDVVPFYDVSPGFGAKAISIKIERPYAADDFVLVGSNSQMVRTSKYISDMRQMKISGTITLSQNVPFAGFTDTGAMAFHFGNILLTVSNPKFITGKEMSISGRSPVTKTLSWTCSSASLIL